MSTASPSKETTASISAVTEIELETALLRSIPEAKPVGRARHFTLLKLQNEVHRRTGVWLEPADLWERLEGLYNLELLNTISSSPPPSLPALPPTLSPLPRRRPHLKPSSQSTSKPPAASKTRGRRTASPSRSRRSESTLSSPSPPASDSTPPPPPRSRPKAAGPSISRSAAVINSRHFHSTFDLPIFPTLINPRDGTSVKSDRSDSPDRDRKADRDRSPSYDNSDEIRLRRARMKIDEWGMGWGDGEKEADLDAWRALVDSRAEADDEDADWPEGLYADPPTASLSPAKRGPGRPRGSGKRGGRGAGASSRRESTATHSRRGSASASVAPPEVEPESDEEASEPEPVRGKRQKRKRPSGTESVAATEPEEEVRLPNPLGGVTADDKPTRRRRR